MSTAAPIGATATPPIERAYAAADSVTDPELPMLTLRDLGVLRDVRLAESIEPSNEVLVVSITPTYTGCPAMATMRSDLEVALRSAGFDRVEVRTVLDPPWSTDWITAAGLQALADHGIAPPGAAPRHDGPVPLTLGPPRLAPRCPLCGSARTTELSRFGSTACKALYRCEDCREPFDHFKEL